MQGQVHSGPVPFSCVIVVSLGSFSRPRQRHSGTTKRMCHPRIFTEENTVMRTFIEHVSPPNAFVGGRVMLGDRDDYVNFLSCPPFYGEKDGYARNCWFLVMPGCLCRA